jgi:hypothetical protein
LAAFSNSGLASAFILSSVALSTPAPSICFCIQAFTASMFTAPRSTAMTRSVCWLMYGVTASSAAPPPAAAGAAAAAGDAVG